MGVAKKSMRRKTMLLGSVALFFVLFSCSEKLPDDNYFAEVNFFNESSYSVSVHQSYFGGSLLVNMLASGDNEWVKVPPSDNYGVGSMFSIVYYWPMEAIGAEFTDVYISSIDPDMQISQNIEAGGSYSISIPNPSQLEFTEKFLKILNASDMPFELSYLNIVYIQAGNGELSVPKGKTGVYKIDRDLDYTIVQVFKSYPMPKFTSENGYVYNFEFDGEEVKEMGKEKIGFNW